MNTNKPQINMTAIDHTPEPNDNALQGTAAPVTSSHVDVKSLRIRELNDTFRRNFVGGRVMLTQGIMALGKIVQAEIISKVSMFNAFNDGNDPYREHDFGCIKHGGETAFFKIDYYDLSLINGSPDPANAAVTMRVLTIMLANEW